MASQHDFKSDVLIIGGAVAGLYAAIFAKRAGADVLVVDKATSGRSGSSIMLCGWWNHYNPDWGHDLDEMMEYNNKNSSYLNDRKWSEILLKESWGAFEDLWDFGCTFPCSMDEMKDYFENQMKESFSAVTADSGIHADPEFVNTKTFGKCPIGFRELPPQLKKYAKSLGVRFKDRTFVTDLIISDGVCTGAIGFEMDTGDCCVFNSKTTLMAAGKNTFKAPGMAVCMQTGDANAMSYRAGAVMTGGEFPDMHTTLTLYPYWKSNGGQYSVYQLFTRNNGKGAVPWRGFDLGMVSAIHAGQGPVLWDLDQATEADKVLWKLNMEHRDTNYELERADVDIDKGGKYTMAGGAVAGGPAEQSCGAWMSDYECRTTVPGLWAAGDACCTWAWGAILNGPPPGLMPAGVTGKISGKSMAAASRELPLIPNDPDEIEKLKKTMYAPITRDGGYTYDYATSELQHLMMPYYILQIKHGKRLKAALDMLDFHKEHMVPRLYARNIHELRQVHEYKNMVVNAEIILTSSLERKESRGWHYREDFPERDDNTQLSWTTMRLSGGKMKVEKIPVPEEWQPDHSKPEDELYDKLWFAWEN